MRTFRPAHQLAEGVGLPSPLGLCRHASFLLRKLEGGKLVIHEHCALEPTVGYKPTLDFESSALNQLSHPSLGPENYSSDASAQARIYAWY